MLPINNQAIQNNSTVVPNVGKAQAKSSFGVTLAKNFFGSICKNIIGINNFKNASEAFVTKEETQEIGDVKVIAPISFTERTKRATKEVGIGLGKQAIAASVILGGASKVATYVGLLNPASTFSFRGLSEKMLDLGVLGGKLLGVGTAVAFKGTVTAVNYVGIPLLKAVTSVSARNPIRASTIVGAASFLYIAKQYINSVKDQPTYLASAQQTAKAFGCIVVAGGMLGATVRL